MSKVAAVPYGDPRYWEERYKMDDKKSQLFDWLFDYRDVKDLLFDLLPDKTASLLVIGCGNSELSNELFKAGYGNMLNIDTSQTVIAQMSKLHPEQTWSVGNALALADVAQNSVAVSLDKSTLDAIRCGKPGDVERLILEQVRVLRPDGRYIILSLTALDELYSYFTCLGDLAEATFYRIRNAARDNAVYSLVIVDKRPVREGDEEVRWKHPLFVRGVEPGRYMTWTRGRWKAFSATSSKTNRL